MLYLLAAILSGHLLGMVVRKKRLAYWLSLPVSIMAYVLTKTMLAYVSGGANASPEVVLALVTGFLSTPLVILGVVLARRKRSRDDYAP